MGKLIFTEADYAAAAIKYRKELLMLPVLGIERTKKYMTGRPGIRYAERVGDADAEAQLAPYSRTHTTDVDLNLNLRTLRTYLGSVVANFEPNSAVSTLLGAIGDTKGDGQIQTPTAKLVLARIAKNLGKHLNAHIWDAVRKDDGTTTADLFDGFDTITSREIAAGDIAVAKKNLIEVDAITTDNAVDVAQAVVQGMTEELREEESFFYCSYDFLDKYNKAYQKTVGAVPYNQTYDKMFVEGSHGRVKFAPLSNKAGSPFIHVSPKENMLLGYDQMSDAENVKVKEYEPFLLSYVATMFFGTQFESIDPRRLMVAKIGA